MLDQFNDIKIVALDDEASGPSGQGVLLRLVLKLSQSAPSAWSQYFNDAWRQHLYMMKRRASVSGDRLEIICTPDELEKDHLPELNKVIAETNEAYGKYAQEQKRLKEIEIEAARRQSEALSDLKGRLKFD
jgi:hypothetical protein